jgi:hypothetical protein
VIAAGGVAGGAAVVEHERHAESAPAARSTEGAKEDFGSPAVPGRSSAATRGEPNGALSSGRARGRLEARERPTRAKERTARGRLAREERSRGHGRGPVETPPSSTPVRRGPPEAKVRPAKPVKPVRRVKPVRPAKPDKPMAEPQARSGHGQNGVETGKPEPKGKAR